MNSETLLTLIITLTIIGAVVVLMAGIFSYLGIRRADKNGCFKDYLQSPLSNTDGSIKDAVEYLKIVNSSEDEKLNDE